MPKPPDVRAKKDDNQAKIEAAARESGWNVEDMSRAGNGFPDLILTQGPYALFVEVKMGRNGALTLPQYHWFLRNCRRLIALVVCDPEDIKRIPKPGTEAWEQYVVWYKQGGYLGFDRWRVKGMPKNRPRLGGVA